MKKVQNYLTEEELKKILESINTSTKVGRRNLVLLALLYDTAARAEEIIHLKVEDIRLEENLIILTGKGKKQRVVPIMENTKDLLVQYLKESKNNTKYLFGETITYSLLHHLFLQINELVPSKKITPHTFRRTRATHLLEKDVNILYIQEFLGHEDISTTQTYAKIIEKSKFEAIAKATSQADNDSLPDWNADQNLLTQLLNL